MKKLKKFTALLTMILAFNLAFSDAVPLLSSNVTASAATIKISKKKATLIKGQSVTLKIAGTKSKIAWKSSNKKVASISLNGKVTAKKKGNATITAKIGKKKLICKITVENPSISNKKITLKKGEETTLKINGTKQKVSWKSSDANIVSVNKKGIVKANHPGTATITGSVLNKKYKCIVTVKDSTPSPTENSYKIGAVWEVPGQWKVTINSVTETNYRNEYSDLKPDAVYMIDFTYENIGYVDKSGLMNGLFIDFDLSTIIDSEGYTGYSYPGDITNYAKEIPVGAKCQAQSCIGVSHKGNFKLYYSAFDGNNVERNAIFEINIDQE